MIITQGYQSHALRHFGFLSKFNLRQYTDKQRPLVIFGCYDDNDYTVIRNHQSNLVIVWCGADVRNIRNIELLNQPNIIHCSDHWRIIDKLRERGLRAIQLKCFSDTTDANPTVLGSKIYTYIPKQDSNYYGKQLVDKIKTPYEIIVGDLIYTKKEWDNGIADTYYSQCFIGLALSEWGGLAGIIEMGLRGIPVITNIVELPHTIPFKTVQDIEYAINYASHYIGMTNIELSQQVHASVIMGKMNGFNLAYLIKK
jgi:hypothetical protein